MVSVKRYYITEGSAAVFCMDSLTVKTNSQQPSITYSFHSTIGNASATVVPATSVITPFLLILFSLLFFFRL
jgi:hypothetical protein